WIDGAGKPVLRHDRQLLRLRLRQRGVGGDDGDGRVLARPALAIRHEARRRYGRRKTEAAEFAVHLERGCPEVGAVADRDPTAGVRGDERAHSMTVARARKGRAEPALEVVRGGAEAGTGGPPS